MKLFIHENASEKWKYRLRDGGHFVRGMWPGGYCWGICAILVKSRQLNFYETWFNFNLSMDK